MSAGEHPGLVIEDEVRGTVRRVAADAVPESMAWGVLDGERVPVVRVLTTAIGENRLLVRSFDGRGREVERTVGVVPAESD